MKRNMNKEENSSFHVPVLLNEVIENLLIKAGAWYIDATAGGGGHTEAILEAGGRVIACDQDQDAVSYLQNKFARVIEEKRLRVVRTNFRKLSKVIQENEAGHIAGILFDLGMSTYQIRDSGRGFSFREDELLDMRMSDTTDINARIIVNKYPEYELVEIIRKWGEERLARPIARAIVRTRSVSEIETTRQLTQLIDEVYERYGNKRKHIEPATRTFQALRIAVNDELVSIKEGLQAAIELLEDQGRCIVISFHSLEDRIIKQQFREWEADGRGVIVTKRPITATEEERHRNPSARSAKLRVFTKKIT